MLLAGEDRARMADQPSLAPLLGWTLYALWCLALNMYRILSEIRASSVLSAFPYFGLVVTVEPLISDPLISDHIL